MAEARSQVPANRANELPWLAALERKVLWLSSWIIHHANHVRPSRDGLKVGGHQASCASVTSLMTALYFHTLRSDDRVAVKPHASPVFHAIEYLLGQQDLDKLKNFRALGGAQSYPSRTKDTDNVDFSTGSVGLGAAITSFASLVQDYLKNRGLGQSTDGRMIAVVGDAELDEGNVFEALLEGWKHDIRNVWWVIDYNRQSLDNTVTDRLFGPIEGLFKSMGWNVMTLKYGKQLQAAFQRPGGEALRRWIDECPNSLYSALTFKGGAAWRARLSDDLGHVAEIRALLESLDDDALASLLTNLAGHDLEAILEAFDSVDDDQPYCFIAYTVKGFGLPLAGHKDNHAGLMNPAQMDVFKDTMNIPDGAEWDHFAGLDMDHDALQQFLREVPYARTAKRRHQAARIDIPPVLPTPRRARRSTQEGFGRILAEIAREDSDMANRIVTTSPDVTVSTNLGGWVNRRDIFDKRKVADTFKEQDVASPQTWRAHPRGQHIELGIAEHNLFLLLGALGLAHDLFGQRLLPIGTLYDPFIKRGLDALNYALYQDARFMVVATPSGVTLAPEGGAHQSIVTPLIGIGLDKLASFEPAFVDELAHIMQWGFNHMQDMDGGSVYLRLSTRAIEQPVRELVSADVIAGAYWAHQPGANPGIVLAYAGAVAPEAHSAFAAIQQDFPDAGLLAITSMDRLHGGWTDARRQRRHGDTAVSHIEQLLHGVTRDTPIVTILDAHPASLSWLGGVRGHRLAPLGVEHFGQSGDIIDLYKANGLDSDAIVDTCARVLIDARSDLAGGAL
jgi:pyruvate dehydrogenase E1 component